MNPNRRSLLTTSALLAPAAVLAACSMSPATVSSVEQVLAKIQAVMPYISGIVSIAGIVAPGATTAVNLVQAALTSASSIFANLSSTMTTAAAQPLVEQIATYLGTALTDAKPVIAALPANAQAQATLLLAEAQTIVGDLNAFAGLVDMTAYLAAPTVPTHLFVRAVK